MSGETRSRKLVVAGLVLKGDRILITQRMDAQAMPLKWEFPGGKMEPGESPEEALRRELREEIAVDTKVHGVWDVLFHAYPDFDLVMLIYPCSIVDEGEPECREVADFAWVRPDEMTSYDVLEADAPLVQRLIREGPPSLVP